MIKPILPICFHLQIVMKAYLQAFIYSSQALGFPLNIQYPSLEIVILLLYIDRNIYFQVSFYLFIFNVLETMHRLMSSLGNHRTHRTTFFHAKEVEKRKTCKTCKYMKTVRSVPKKGNISQNLVLAIQGISSKFHKVMLCKIWPNLCQLFQLSYRLRILRPMSIYICVFINTRISVHLHFNINVLPTTKAKFIGSLFTTSDDMS